MWTSAPSITGGVASMIAVGTNLTAAGCGSLIVHRQTRAEEHPMSDEGKATNASEPDDVKARFKEALERKQASQKKEHLHPDGDSALHDTHGRSGGKRQFRRKSGG
jgi:hypothetical protein